MTIDLSKVAEIAEQNFPYIPGAFYGAAAGLSLGVGLIYDGVKYPLFDREEGLFDTAIGPSYILTHECDVDPANDRNFNDYILICPIMPFDNFALQFDDDHSEGALMRFLPPLFSDKVFRVFYFPPFPGASMPYGGLIYLNQICSTHVSEFQTEAAQPICALSSYAQQILDRKIENHLLRPKAERLPKLR